MQHTLEWFGLASHTPGLDISLSRNVMAYQSAFNCMCKRMDDLAASRHLPAHQSACTDHSPWPITSTSHLRIAFHDFPVTPPSRHVPTKITALEGQTIVSVRCGWRHSIAVTDRGLMYTFGWNKYGQCGHGDCRWAKYKNEIKE